MIQATGQIREGKLHLYNRESLNAQVESTRDCEVMVTIAKQGDPKSRQLERWMHGVAIKMICDETGNDHDTIWEFIKRKFRPVPVFLGDDMLIVGKSTAGPSMSLEEQKQLKDQVQIWAASDLSINIPDPNEGDST